MLLKSQLEITICSNEFFKAFATMGRPRLGHPEGNLGIHVEHILGAIDKLKVKKYRKIFRLAAILHDVGKLAMFSHAPKYVPKNISISDQKKLLATSLRFKKKYAIGKKLKFVPDHAQYSVNFAKEFTNDPVLLNLILLHDTGPELCFHFNKTGKYSSKEFVKFFHDKDIALYILFSFVDSVDRDKGSSYWMQDQAISLGLLTKPVLPARKS